jgi:hypothetical protein
MVACIKSIPNHPGAVNPVDNALYDGILTVRAGLESAKTQFQGVTAVVNALNTSVIPPFNKLESGYAAYHTALVAGKADPAALTELQTELAAVTAALSTALKNAPPAPVPAAPKPAPVK